MIFTTQVLTSGKVTETFKPITSCSWIILPGVYSSEVDNSMASCGVLESTLTINVYDMNSIERLL